MDLYSHYWYIEKGRSTEWISSRFWEPPCHDITWQLQPITNVTILKTVTIAKIWVLNCRIEQANLVWINFWCFSHNKSVFAFQINHKIEEIPVISFKFWSRDYRLGHVVWCGGVDEHLDLILVHPTFADVAHLIIKCIYKHRSKSLCLEPHQIF